MARTYFTVLLGAALGEGRYSLSSGRGADQLTPVSTTSTDATAADTAAATLVGATQTATEAAVATLEADGVAPTQAHVTALRTVWNATKTQSATVKAATLLAKNDAATAATIVGAAGLSVSYDPAVFVNRRQLHAALTRVLHTLAGDGSLVD